MYTFFNININTNIWIQVLLPDTQSLVVCGGVFMAPNTTAPTHNSGQCMNDVWVLRIDSASSDSSVGLSLTWIQVRSVVLLGIILLCFVICLLICIFILFISLLYFHFFDWSVWNIAFVIPVVVIYNVNIIIIRMLGISPSPRGRQQSVVSKRKGSGEKILIFGGSDEWYGHQGGNQNSLEVDSQMFMINTDQEVVQTFKRSRDDGISIDDDDVCEYEWLWESPSCGIIDNQLLIAHTSVPATVPTTAKSTTPTTIPNPLPLHISPLKGTDIDHNITSLAVDSVDAGHNKSTLSANLLTLLLCSQENKDNEVKECFGLETDLVTFSIHPTVNDSNDQSEKVNSVGDDQMVEVPPVNFTAHISIVTARCKMLKSLLVWEQQKIATMEAHGHREAMNEEGRNDGRLVVEIRDCNPLAFAALLLYLYTDVLLVDSEHLILVLALAHQYGLKHLESLCEGYLCRQVLGLSQEHQKTGCVKDLTGVSGDPKRDTLGCSIKETNNLTIGQEKMTKSNDNEDEGMISQDCDPILQLLQYADLYHLKVLKAVCFSSVLRNFNPHSLLNELSAELIEEVEVYRLTHRHAYMIDHHPRSIT
jgi:hypothetical protein